jgi:hypothetical protein
MGRAIIIRTLFSNTIDSRMYFWPFLKADVKNRYLFLSSVQYTTLEILCIHLLQYFSAIKKCSSVYAILIIPENG